MTDKVPDKEGASATKPEVMPQITGESSA